MGQLTVFRWNTGYRAESTPVLQQAMTESDFQALALARRLPENKALFKGCYLAHYQAPPGRAPATAGLPKSEIRRICVPGTP